MNKLKTTDNGGMPLVLDDIRWIDEAYREAWFGFLSAFGIDPSTSFKISGCNISVSNQVAYTTAGYISFCGEILKVDAHSYDFSANPNDPVVWMVEETYDAAGNKQFFDASSHDTYQIRRGRLTTEYAQDSMDCNAPWLSQLLAPSEEAWHYIGTNGEPAFESPWANFGFGYQNLRYKKDLHYYLMIDGAINGGVTGSIIFTLPSGYRPSTVRIVGVVGIGAITGGAGAALIKINTTGQVIIMFLAGWAGAAEVYLNIRVALD